MSRKANIAGLVFTLLMLSVHGQESIGLQLSNYLPATSIQLNPALSVDSKTRLDIHLIGGAIFLTNDHGYFAKEGPGFFGVAAGNGGDPRENMTPGTRNAYLDNSIDGPGFVMALGRSSIGLTSRQRNMVVANGVPDGLAQFIANGFRHAPLYDSLLTISDMKLNYLKWIEVGFTYGQMLHVTSDQHINAAITVKRLFGQRLLGIHAFDTDYMFTSDDLIINGLSGSYLIAESGLGVGNGWSMDMGFVYRKTIKGKPDYVPYSAQSRCHKSQYRYEVGVSLLDLGALRFKNNGAMVSHSESSVYWPDYIETSTGNIAELDAQLIDIAENDQSVSKRSASASITLPAALSLQFDYNFDNGYHLGGVMQQPLTGSQDHSLRRARLLGVVPRYEKVRFEASLPISFYEMKRLQVGAAFRMNFFTIGSDDMVAVVSGGDLYGADFYASLRIPLYNTTLCRVDRKGRRKGLVAPCWGQ